MDRKAARKRGKKAPDRNSFGLEQQVGDLLRARGWTLAVAESCTGGLVSHRITSVSGSSDYFLGGVIAYSNDVKVSELGVKPRVLARDGAVSEIVARQMASGVRRRLGADLGIGITGIAGPGGGTAKKSVGLVFISVAHGARSQVRRFVFSGDRIRVKMAASAAALKMLKEYLQEKGAHHG